MHIPEKIAPLYKKIAKRYKVGFETLKLGKEPLKLLQISDLEPLLAGKDPFKDVSTFPFWVKLWEASMVLASLLASMPAKRRGNPARTRRRPGRPRPGGGAAGLSGNPQRL